MRDRRVRAACFVLLILGGMAIADDATPIQLSGKDAARICHNRASDDPNCVTPPHATYSPDPEYPDSARKARESATIILSVVVDPQGKTRDVKVDHPGTAALDQAAIDCVKKWKFTPATKNGNPVAVQLKVEVSFNIR